MTGRFIVFEGGEGAGKTTQIRHLAKTLTEAGKRIVLTREPGGSEGAESLRNLLVTGTTGRWSALSEVLMMYAARNDHLEKTIRPALDAGAWVLCDRFSDSSRADQGAAGGIDAQFIEALDLKVVGSTQPDLVIVLDLNSEAGLRRAAARPSQNNESEDRFEMKGPEFHQKLRQAFLDRAQNNPDHYVIIDADADEISIRAHIFAVCQARFGSEFRQIR